MTFFVFINWFTCGLTLLVLVLIFLRHRYLFIKPSMIVIVFFHLQIQWAATIFSGYIEAFLPNPFPFFFLVQGFPLISLVVSFFLLHNKAHDVFNRVATGDFESIRVRPIHIISFLTLGTLIVFFYLLRVPFSSTGLFAIFVDPMGSAEAREQSLKLLNEPALKYAFSFFKTVFAPMLAVLSTVYLMQSFKKLRLVRVLAAGVTLIYIISAVSLPGARKPAALIVFAVFWALFLVKRMKVRPVYVLLTVFLVVLLPVLLTVFREGQELNLLQFADYLSGPVLERIFYIPMEVGLWHVHYAQKFGLIGIAGIPKLAELFAVEPVNVMNLIYTKYTFFDLSSGFANTSYVFSYYSFFGLISLIFSCVLLWLLDLGLLVFDRMKNSGLILAGIAALTSSSISFVAIDYTIGLITNGFLVILIVVVLMERYTGFLSGRKVGE